VRKTEFVIDDIKILINTKGFIYALCMILFEDFHIDPEKLHKINYNKRLSANEATLLLGFLIQKGIDFSIPDNYQDLFQIRQRIYELMEELHQSFMIPFGDRLKKSLEKEINIENYRREQKEFFGNGEMLIEPIFYSGTGVYDFQYLDFLEKKYIYDKEWLAEKKNFDIDQVKQIVNQIKNILQHKSEKVRLYDFEEGIPQMIEKLKEKNKNEDWELHINEQLPYFKLHQYSDLFLGPANDNKSMDKFNKINNGWKSFYEGLVDLFIIEKSSFNNELNIDSFLNNFSVSIEENLNSQFEIIGNYNIINARPIIKLDEEKYFVPVPFLIFEAVYESPFYWMWLEDKSYRDQLGINRGKVGEEITYTYLSKVFGEDNTFKSIKVITKKGQEDTDIDVLCILGSKVLCVQVKSKKLTELSRTGNDEQLNKDFQGAVQDAYVQGIVAREKILSRNSKFIDEHGNELKLSGEIDEAYIMCITTENYPSLTHQSHILLDKKDNEPFPIVLTIFDLELLVYYLNNPFDFLYYIKQRISTMDYFIAEEEMVFLGYHLDQKLWRIPNSDLVTIESDYGQMIDRNYFPIKAKLKVSDEGDAIKSKWKNDKFNQLCNDLTKLNLAIITDIIFQLNDLSDKTREDLVNYIIERKRKTLSDGKSHNIVMPPSDDYLPRMGMTYVSLNSDDMNELQKRLSLLCELRKYASKADVWIGLGSLKSSINMVNTVVFVKNPWIFDNNLEIKSRAILGTGKIVKLVKSTGRNEKCPCGSGLKYKKCHGKY
jgi:hypothetical protein